MKCIYLTVITLLPIATTEIAFASNSHQLPQPNQDFISLYNSDQNSDVRQGIPERRISGSSRFSAVTIGSGSIE